MVALRLPALHACSGILATVIPEVARADVLWLVSMPCVSPCCCAVLHVGYGLP